MDREPWISDQAYWMPRHVVESAWLEHAPFAFWLVSAVRPDSIVELGTHNGFSYFAFSEAVVRLGLPTRTYALDSWQGDDQAGFYGDDVYEKVRAVNEAEFSEFSTLLRGYFDDSLDAIDDASVDLLHIDGRHGYDDVRHDFEAWLPKLTQRGVVIFHDTAERQEGFGVWKFWAEIRTAYPSFEFEHGHGLGVLAVGPQVSPKLAAFFEAATTHSDAIRATYAELGANVSRQYTLELAAAETPRLSAELDAANRELSAQAQETDRLVGEVTGARAETAGLAAELRSRNAEIRGLNSQIAQLKRSTSWKVTGPLRAVSGAVNEVLRRPR